MSIKGILKIIFPGLYGVLVYATVRLLQDTGKDFYFWKRPLLTNAIEIGMSILVGWLAVKPIQWICARHDRPAARKRRGNALFIREVLWVVAVNIIVVNAFLTPMAAFTDDGLSRSDFVYINTVPLLYMLIYYGILRSNRFLKAYVRQQVLVEKLTNDRLETELKFLKAQYHPHFLFNALNTVYFQMDEDVPAAKTSLEKLSALLRYQLYDQQHKVSMAQELDYLHNFMDLQKTRSHEQLVLTVQLDPGLASQQVYPLLFLPLVENAFKYVGGGQSITIAMSFQSGRIDFTVENSVSATPVLRPKAGGIGLDNLKRRLELLYPNKHELNFIRSNQLFTAQLLLDPS